MNSRKIVDTHQHFWDLSCLELAWLDDSRYETLRRDCTLGDYQADCSGIEVVKTVYMEVDAAISQQMVEAEHVSALCQRSDNQLAAAIASGRPGTTGFAQQARRLARLPGIKGLRDVGRPAQNYFDPGYVSDVGRLGDLGLSFDVDVSPSDLLAVEHLVGRCPSTRFILDHAANPDIRSGDLSSWKAHVAVLAGRDNVLVKVSGLLSHVDRNAWGPEDLAPVVDHLFDVFGPQRVMFGSDWPVCTLTASYHHWVSAVQAVVSEHTEEHQRALFHDNAVRFYGL